MEIVLGIIIGFLVFIFLISIGLSKNLVRLESQINDQQKIINLLTEKVISQNEKFKDYFERKLN